MPSADGGRPAWPLTTDGGGRARPVGAEGRVADAVEGLTPGYFAMVMASGIISLGLDLGGFTAASVVLFGAGVLGYVVPWSAVLA